MSRCSEPSQKKKKMRTRDGTGTEMNAAVTHTNGAALSAALNEPGKEEEQQRHVDQSKKHIGGGGT